MTVILVVALIIAIIIIYNLNAKNEDNKVIKANYSWKEKIRELRDSIEYLESKEVNEIDKVRIESHKKEILKLQGYIYDNEKYLKKNGRI